MRHFYAPEINPADKFYQMDAEESKHVVKVLRLKEGDYVALLNGKGYLFEAEISNASQKGCEFIIKGVQFQEKSKYSIHIVLAPTKQTERTEWFIEKATELGATHLSFIETKNSERTHYKYDRFERKVISAFKQSQRYYIPELSREVMTFDQFIENNPNGLIAHCYDSAKSELRAVFQSNNCPVLIGPEGDFTLDEVTKAEKHGYKAISLGKTRLRTETAALYACSIMKEICE